MKVLIMWLAICLIATSVMGEVTSAKKSTKLKSKKSNKVNSGLVYSTKTIDLNCKRVAPRYLGHSIYSIRKALEQKFQIQKDEYETTDAFEVRSNNILRQAIFGNLTLESYFVAAVIPVSLFKKIPFEDKIIANLWSEGVKQRYDADSRTLSLELTDTYCMESKLMHYTCINGEKTIYEEPDYVASNAMGATIQVSKRMSILENVVLNNVDGKSFPSVKFTDIDLDTAKKLRNDLGILIIYKLIKPYYSSSIYRHEPKFNEPADFSIHRNSVEGDLIQYWVYRFSTGEILAKFTYPTKEQTQ